MDTGISGTSVTVTEYWTMDELVVESSRVESSSGHRICCLEQRTRITKIDVSSYSRNRLQKPVGSCRLAPKQTSNQTRVLSPPPPAIASPPAPPAPPITESNQTPTLTS